MVTSQLNSLTNLMCHSESTAKKSYYLQDKTAKASDTSTSLRALLREHESRKESESIQEESIKNIFQDEITSEKITLTIVREKRTQSPELMELTDIQIRDKVRYYISCREKGTRFSMLISLL